MQPTTIGLDLAKHVFQVHAVAADGKVPSWGVSLAPLRLRRSSSRPLCGRQGQTNLMYGEVIGFCRSALTEPRR